MTPRPNILLILTDQQHDAPVYESDELAEFRREHLAGVERLRQNGVSFRHHYPMSAACAPSRTSLLTGHYPSLHGVTQTDGIAKRADSDDMFWLAPDSVPTLGDWFRAGGYRTYYKGKWHVSHPHLDADDGDGYLLSIDDDGTPIEDNIQKYLERRPARRLRLLGVGRARPARTRQAQHRPAQGPVHRRRDDRVARSASTRTRATRRG